MKTLSFAVVVAMVTAAHAQTIDESTVSGPHDVTALIVGRPGKPSKTPCKPPGEPRLVAYGTGKSYRVVFYRTCDAAETRDYEERWARSVRERLGDPGHH